MTSCFLCPKFDQIFIYDTSIFTVIALTVNKQFGSSSAESSIIMMNNNGGYFILLTNKIVTLEAVKMKVP